MAIKANLDLVKVREIIERRYERSLNCFLGEMIIVHPNEEPIVKLILSRHTRNVRENEKVHVGGAYMTSIPEYLRSAVIEW